MSKKICVICGREFEAKNCAVTCSPECGKMRKKLYMKQYGEDNKEELREKAKARAAKDPEHKKEYMKQWNIDNRDYRREYNKRYREEHKDEIRVKKAETHAQKAIAKRKTRALERQEELSAVLDADKPLQARITNIPDSLWETVGLTRLGFNKFKCNACGKEFLQPGRSLDSFITSAKTHNVCPFCGTFPYGITRVSGPELELKRIFPEFSVLHYRPEWLGGLELDLYSPEHNVAIEFEGLHFHCSVKKSERNEMRNKHKMKTDLCEKNGIQLLTIFENEWKDRRDCCIDKISAILHRPMERLMARKMTVEWADVGTREFNERRHEYVSFLEKNHIQGAGTAGTFRVGLRDKTGKLTAVCCFQNRHGRSAGEAGQWDLCRFAVCLGTTVAGALQRCISVFKKQHPEWTELTSLADRRWTAFSRSAYSSVGFAWDGKEPQADYFYIVDGEPKNKSCFQIKNIMAKFPDAYVEGEDNTEWAMMERVGIPYIYDCGKIRYVMKK